MMKFQVYSEKDIFENIWLDNVKYSNWNNILKFHADVYLNISKQDFEADIDDTENSILFQFLQATGGKGLKDDELFFIEFEKDNSVVLSSPLSVFFLNKDDSIIRELSEKFGLIFQNEKIEDSLLSNTFFKNFKKGDVYKDGVAISWETLKIPFRLRMNSLVITEEHLFHNEKNVRGIKVNVGLENLLGFLNLVLPQNLGVDFHLVVVTELKNASVTEDIAKEYYDKINTQLATIRSYKIVFELVFTNETLHNRSAYSNYQVITLDKGYKVFSVFGDGKVEEKNKLTVNQIFLVSKPDAGDTHYQEIIDDIPIIKKGIKNSTEYVKAKGNGFPNFKCFGISSTFSIQNRLINHFP
ncbi:hypothetical protein [Kaistella sp.]|uniref:hypothetical protein n=1 Tax=Kaistella sp. TaxID=2782235 RepID=UPI002F92B6DE